jgi:hypothetical protein
VVANRLWSDVATAPLQEPAPLAQLTAAASAGVPVVAKNDGSLVKPGQTIADTLMQHGAPAAVAEKLHDLQHVDAMRMGDSQVWLLDQVAGTLSCHIAMAVSVPSNGSAHEIALPARPDPTDLCALSALNSVTINGVPALWTEQSGAYTASFARSTITIAALRDEAFAPPCDVVVDYAITYRAAHAFCDGVDCIPLIGQAQVLAMRLQRGETAETLGAGVISPDRPKAAMEYHRMVDLLAAEKPAAELPTFGASLDTPYTAFSDQVTFPIQFNGGPVYLARMGHGGLGWRQTADTLLALYRLHDDRLTPAASLYLEARRTGIAGVTVK